MMMPSACPCCKGRVAITAAPSPLGIMKEMVALSSTGVLRAITIFTVMMRTRNRASVITAPHRSQSTRFTCMLTPMNTKKNVRSRKTSSLKKFFSASGNTIFWLGTIFSSSRGSKYCRLPIAMPKDKAVSGPLKWRYSVMPYNMNKNAGVENLVAFKVWIRLMINDHRKAPLIPITNAITSEEINCATRVCACISPVSMNPSMLNGIARVNTSVSADSMIRVVAVFGFTGIFLTNPTTTAEDVPPNAAPMNRLVKSGNWNMTILNTVVVIQVVMNPKVVMPADSLNEDFTSAILRSVPLSKRMNISTRLLNREPNLPKEEGSTK